MIALVQLADIISNGDKTENKYISYIVIKEDGKRSIVETQEYIGERHSICRMGEEDS